MAVCSSAAALLHLPIAPCLDIHPPEEVLLILLEMSLEEEHFLELDTTLSALPSLGGVAHSVF